MAVFSYKARDEKQQILTGVVEAPSAEIAARLLREKHFFVINLTEKREGVGLSLILARFQKVGTSDIVNFTRQLSTMVTAGLNLPDALTILRTQTTNPVFARMLVDIEHQIVGGGNLADSLAKYPHSFSTIYLALIRAGEASGTLDLVLARLAETLEAEREFKGKVQGAMIYPAIIIIGMVGVVFVMMTVVMPKLTDLYKDFGIELPTSTKILIALSDFSVHFWWLVILAVFGLSIAFEKWRKTSVGEYTVDAVILKIPIIGSLQEKVLLVEFTRTLGMLISSGIHILQGLQILRDSIGNVLFRNAIDEITKKVEKGFPLGDAFSEHEIFPPIVSQMMKVGEETGKLDETLGKLAKYFQSESEHLVAGLTTAIEPIVMIILGIGVFFIVTSVITPIYNLTSSFK